jgi:hypothetical protein
MVRIKVSRQRGRRFAMRGWHNAFMRLLSAAIVLTASGLLIATERSVFVVILITAWGLLFASTLNWTGYVTVTPTAISLRRTPRDPILIVRESVVSAARVGASDVEITYTKRRFGVGEKYVASVVLHPVDGGAFLDAIANQPSEHTPTMSNASSISLPTIIGVGMVASAAIYALFRIA